MVLGRWCKRQYVEMVEGADASSLNVWDTVLRMRNMATKNFRSDFVGRVMMLSCHVVGTL